MGQWRLGSWHSKSLINSVPSVQLISYSFGAASSRAAFCFPLAMIFPPTENVHEAVPTVDPSLSTVASMSKTYPTLAIEIKSTPMLIVKRGRRAANPITKAVTLSISVAIEPPPKYLLCTQNLGWIVNLNDAVLVSLFQEMNSICSLNYFRKKVCGEFAEFLNAVLICSSIYVLLYHFKESF
jgi:hypothetical protein